MHNTSLFITITLTLLVPFITAHGLLTHPAPRPPGPSFGSICGSQLLSQQTADPYGNIQGEMQVLPTNFNATACNLWLCKGMQFSDNPSTNIQAFTPGQIIPITFDIRAPHTGVANMSIVDTAKNTVIGKPLMSWDVFASTAVPIQADQLNFSVTIPDDLDGRCTEAGQCVLQHFWDAKSIDQTYESCIDFTMSGSGANDGSVPVRNSTAAASSVAAAATSSGTPANSGQVAATSTSASASASMSTTSTNTAIALSTSLASAAASVAPTNTFTTALTVPSGASQKFICYVE